MSKEKCQTIQKLHKEKMRSKTSVAGLKHNWLLQCSLQKNGDSLSDTAGHIISKPLGVGVCNFLPQGFHLVVIILFSGVIGKK